MTFLKKRNNGVCQQFELTRLNAEVKSGPDSITIIYLLEFFVIKMNMSLKSCCPDLNYKLVLHSLEFSIQA